MISVVFSLLPMTAEWKGILTVRIHILIMELNKSASHNQPKLMRSRNITQTKFFNLKSIRAKSKLKDKFINFCVEIHKTVK